MENIYFQPNKENSEFLVILEKLDEYTIPQILERMVDHFRNLPELEDALNKLGIRTNSLEEELDDDIRVEEKFYVGGKPKKLRHFKGDNPTPILIKEWYKNGQLKNTETLNYKDGIRETIAYYENGNLNFEHKSQTSDLVGFMGNIDLLNRKFYPNGQIGTEQIKLGKTTYFDEDGNSISESEYKSSKFYKDSIIGH